MDSSSATSSRYPICRHIKTNGRRCQAPALTGSTVCYFHRILRRTHWPAHAFSGARLSNVPQQVGPLLLEPVLPPRSAFTLPPLEDAESVQLAISTLFTAIVDGQIDPAHSRNLLYALQLASFNVRALAPRSRPSAHGENADGNDISQDTQNTIVRRVVRTRDGHTLAAPGEDNGVPSEAAGRTKSIAEQLLDTFRDQPGFLEGPTE